MSLFLLFYLLCSLASALYAQEPLYRHVGLNEGLMSHSVYAAFQDKDGYMWFGTDEGVCRYDGVEFKYFTTDNGLCDNEVLQIKQDSKGRIWFLTLAGCLCYYLNGQVFNSNTDAGLYHQERTIGHTGMIEDENGVVYIFGISNQVLIYDGKTIKAHQFFDKELALPTITFAFKEEGNKLFFVNQGVVFEKVAEGLKKVYDLGIKYSRPNCFAYSSWGPTLVGLNGLFAFSSKEGHYFVSSNQFNSWNKFIAVKYLAESFWFCLDGGGIEEWRCIDGVWTCVNTYLSDAIVNSVFEDSEQNLWFSTRDQGEFILPKRTMDQRFYPMEKNYQITAMTAVPGSDFYLVGTDHGDIWSVHNGGSGKMELYVKAEKRIGIEQLMATKDGRVLCINHQGIFWVERGGLRMVDEELNLEIPKAMTLDNMGGAYVAALVQCLYIPDLNKPKERYFLRDIPSDRIYHLAVDKKNRLWFEQHDKLYIYENGVMTPHDAFNLMSKGRVSDIEISDDDRVVVSTYGSGVFVLRDEVIDMHFNSSNGLNSNECRFILCNGQMLYIHTSLGLWVVDCSQPKGHVPELLIGFDNLANNKLFEMSVSKSAFYFGTHKGLYSAALGIQPLVGPKSVIIEAINSNPINSADQQNYKANYGQHVSVKFTALCFGWADDLEFQYRLYNLDTNWISTSRRIVDLNNLPWGSNMFQVRTRHPHSVWTVPRTLNINVDVPYYGTWWFRSFLFVLALCGIFIVAQHFIKRRFSLQMEQIESDRLVLAERNRISVDLHDEIGAEVSNIVILSRIAQAKIQNQDSPVSSIEKIDRAANDMINKMNGIIWSLNPSNDDLVNLVEYLKRYGNDYLELHGYSNGVEVIGTISTIQVKGMVRRNVFLILKEALQNIQKHTKSTEVKIRIIISKTQFTLEVIDNGLGFDIAQINRGRLGLTSIKKRAQDIGGTIEIAPIIGVGTTIRANFEL